MKNILERSKNHQDFIEDLIRWGKLDHKEIDNIFNRYFIMPPYPDLIEAFENKQNEKQLKNTLEGFGINVDQYLKNFRKIYESLPDWRSLKDDKGNPLFQEGKTFREYFEAWLNQLKQEKKEIGTAIGRIKILLKSNVISESAKVSLNEEVLSLENRKMVSDWWLPLNYEKMKVVRIIGPRYPRKKSEWLKFLIKALVDYIEPAREKVISNKPIGDAPYIKKTTYGLISEMLSLKGIGTMTIEEIETHHENALKSKRDSFF